MFEVCAGCYPEHTGWENLFFSGSIIWMKLREIEHDQYLHGKPKRGAHEKECMFC